MESTKLHEDLLKSFRDEKEFIVQQLDSLDPLALALRKPVATRMLHHIALLGFEILTWLALLSVLGFCVVRDKIYPFYILARLRNKAALLGFSERDVQYLYNSLYVIAVIIVCILFLLARCIARIRKKNSVLQMAAKTIKAVVGELLQRKATVAAIDQRHFGVVDNVMIPTMPKATEVINPGF